MIEGAALAYGCATEAPLVGDTTRVGETTKGVFEATEGENVGADGEYSKGRGGTGGTGSWWASAISGMLALPHQDFSLGAITSLSSSSKKFLRSLELLSSSSRFLILSVLRRAAHARTATTIANTTTAIAVKTPMTAVRLDKKALFCPELLCT
jgi:hypothetical protein